MTHPSQFFTEEQSREFCKPLAEISKKAAAKPSGRRKPRHSSEIAAEIERAPLGLQAASRRLARAQESLDEAKQRLGRHKAELAKLKAAPWYAPRLPQVKNLVGYESEDRWGTRRQIKGTIEVAEEDVARAERGVATFGASAEAAKKELDKVLKALNAELKEVLPAEDAAAGVVRRGHVLSRGGPSAYDQRMADTGF
jgi:chromosome segregation ATPase